MPIIRTLDNKAMAGYLSRQLNHFFPDENLIDASVLFQHLEQADERIFKCFERIPKKYFNENGTIYFNHLQSDQYAMYLYMLANHIYTTTKQTDIATKLYYLNKALHSVDIYFTSQLPEAFLFVHPQGSILGRAKFSDYFICYQACTVGCLNEGIFPTFNGKVILYAQASVLGDCTVGDNVCIAAGVRVVNTNIPDNVIVLGEYPNYKFVKNTKDIFERPPFVYG